ncbi:MAG: hypothetical protein ACXWF8_08930 [Methylobacter sp.]
MAGLVAEDQADLLWHELYGRPRSLEDRRTRLADRRKSGVRGCRASGNCRAGRRRCACRRAEAGGL